MASDYNKTKSKESILVFTLQHNNYSFELVLFLQQKKEEEDHQEAESRCGEIVLRECSDLWKMKSLR